MPLHDHLPVDPFEHDVLLAGQNLGLAHHAGDRHLVSTLDTPWMEAMSAEAGRARFTHRQGVMACRVLVAGGQRSSRVRIQNRACVNTTYTPISAKPSFTSSITHAIHRPAIAKKAEARCINSNANCRNQPVRASSAAFSST